LQKLINYFLFW